MEKKDDKKQKNDSIALKYYFIETVKETFRIRKKVKNPGMVWNFESIVAILVFITFLITCLGQAFGYSTIPDPLIRIVDIMVGFFFGRGSTRVTPPNAS